MWKPHKLDFYCNKKYPLSQSPKIKCSETEDRWNLLKETYKNDWWGFWEQCCVRSFLLPSQLVWWEVVVKQLFLSENSMAFFFHSHTCFAEASIIPQQNRVEGALQEWDPLKMEATNQQLRFWGLITDPATTRKVYCIMGEKKNLNM